MKSLAFIATLIAASPALALDDMAAMQLSNALGGVLASEEFCGLTYDQDAISAYIGSNVPPERMDFASLLQTNIMGQKYMHDQMGKSEKTAHCTSIAQTAKHFGFLK